MKKKNFFGENTAAEIKKLKNVRKISANLVEIIYNLDNCEALILEVDLIPTRYKNARKFMKHGVEVKLPRVRSLEGAIKRSKTPIQLREEKFNSIKNNAYCGYSFKPIIGTDKRTRKVSLVECIQGAKLYAYSNQERGPRVNVKPYDNARRVSKEGAEVIVEVPSRTEKQSRQQFKFSSVPVIDNSEKLAISYNLSTDHNCPSKRFNIRYRFEKDKESSRAFNFCAHEIAGYLAIVDFYWKENKNIIPLQMSQFAIPTQETVNFYQKLCNNCLIHPKKQKIRKLHRAEQEILLWGLVYKKGHDKTFFATEKIRDYSWKS